MDEGYLRKEPRGWPILPVLVLDKYQRAGFSLGLVELQGIPPDNWVVAQSAQLRGSDRDVKGNERLLFNTYWELHTLEIISGMCEHI